MIDQHSYYNQELFWDYNLYDNDKERIRIDAIINTIPIDVKTILDVGCGNGAVLNQLLKRNKFKRLVGVDFSSVALEYVQTEKYLMNVSELNFRNSEFDLVICNEVLEHLSQSEYNDTLNKINRIATKYILITVPNDEDLEASLCNCKLCKCWFHPEYHVRSFSISTIKLIYENFKCIVTEIKNESFNKFNKIGLIYFRYFRSPQPPEYGICPQCGSKSFVEKKKNKKKYTLKNILIIFFNIGFRLIGMKATKKGRWLLALFSK